MNAKRLLLGELGYEQMRGWGKRNKNENKKRCKGRREGNVRGCGGIYGPEAGTCGGRTG